MPTPRIPLAPVTKTFSLTPSGRRVCTGATTTDGKWGLEQMEDDGTTWFVVRLADAPEDENVVVADCFANLTRCRAYIASGGAAADLALLQAHARGEHAERVPVCAECDREAEAAEFRRQLHGRRAA